MQIPLVYSQVLFSGALSLHSATGLNAKLCLGIELLLMILLFLSSTRRGPRRTKAGLILLATRAWLTTTLVMMIASYALLPLNLR
jgi:hypothetical protein